MKLGFDIDGVISNFAKSFPSIVKKHFDIEITEKDIPCHDLGLVLGIGKEDRDLLIKETFLKGVEPMPDAKEVLSKLYSEGHEILILTARNSDLVDVTKRWLKDKEIPYSQLVFLDEGYKYLCALDVDLIVEDNLDDAIKWSKRVKNILVYDHPWNQSFNVMKLFKRVYSWKDIEKEIDHICANTSMPQEA
ncbi:MAG TPA: hypothetical protein VIH48_05415 [Candidatus Bathyarchaeia archaeon]